jgi:hypothetical protein
MPGLERLVPRSRNRGGLNLKEWTPHESRVVALKLWDHH